MFFALLETTTDPLAFESEGFGDGIPPLHLSKKLKSWIDRGRLPIESLAVPANAIKIWLKKKQGRTVGSAWAYLALSGSVGGLIVLMNAGLLFGFFKLIILSAAPMWRGADILAAVLTLPFVILVFVDCRHANRDDMSIPPLWLVREYVHIGPRLILNAWHDFAEAERFSKIDIDLCADVLAYLSSRTTPVSREELTRAFPWLNWEKLIAELQLIGGIIVFRYDKRVSMLTPLRLEIRHLLGQRIRVEIPTEEPPEEPQPEPVREPEKLSASEILGVSETATVAEIKTAYRNRIKECHPDRFPHLDDQSRRMAEDWTKALNAAYEELLKQRNGGRNR